MVNSIVLILYNKVWCTLFPYHPCMYTELGDISKYLFTLGDGFIGKDFLLLLLFSITSLCFLYHQDYNLF